ncbi:hypothetical protein AMECASPLE_012418 [Ameca splendens]|uniref:Uncharacterized protein n=1 Tax=Ameca splendens TaxID=208324 RepID=A0ABV0XE49_9TELE
MRPQSIPDKLQAGMDYLLVSRYTEVSYFLLSHSYSVKSFEMPEKAALWGFIDTSFSALLLSWLTKCHYISTCLSRRSECCKSLTGCNLLGFLRQKNSLSNLNK